MLRLKGPAFLLLLVVPFLLSPLSAQTDVSAQAQLPRVVRFSGTIANANAAVAGVTFSLYATQDGGTPLWMETQNVSLDAAGHYSILLGSASKDGLPSDLFASNEARWIGVKAESQSELPRVLLVSVPYALKAGDAETLGGKPLSSFVLTPEATAGTDSIGGTATGSTATNAQTSRVALPRSVSGSQNYIAKFDATGTNLINSTLFDNGTDVGIRTSNPLATFHIQGPNSEELGQSTANGAFLIQGAGTFAASMGTRDDGTYGHQYFWIQSRYIDNSVFRNIVLNPSGGNVGIATRLPLAALHVQGPNSEELGQGTANGAFLIQGAGLLPLPWARKTTAPTATSTSGYNPAT